MVPNLSPKCQLLLPYLLLMSSSSPFSPGTLVSSSRKLISSSFHRLDMTLAVAEALNPNNPNLFIHGAFCISMFYSGGLVQVKSQKSKGGIVCHGWETTGCEQIYKCISFSFQVSLKIKADYYLCPIIWGYKLYEGCPYYLDTNYIIIYIIRAGGYQI